MQPPIMTYSSPWPTIGQYAGDPILATLAETQVRQHLEQEAPCDGVKSLGNINLEEDTGVTLAWIDA